MLKFFTSAEVSRKLEAKGCLNTNISGSDGAFWRTPNGRHFVVPPPSDGFAAYTPDEVRAILSTADTVLSWGRK